jgi:hypothetical protein
MNSTERPLGVAQDAHAFQPSEDADARVPDESCSDLVDRLCPVCSTPSTPKDVLVRAPLRAESIDASRRDEYWRGFRSRPCFFDYARCPDCAQLFCPTYYSQTSLDLLYSSMPDNTAGADANVLSATQESYIDYLAAQRPLVGTYMEIGPDIGLATSAASRRGQLQRAILIEPNRSVHEELRSSTRNVPTDIFESIDQLESTDLADTVVLIHVLDHLIDPLAYLQGLRRHMTVGGLLLAVVHNEASLLRRVLGVRWPPFCLQHPQLYRTETLGRVFTEAGFGVVCSSPTKNVLPLRHVVETGASLLGISGSWTRHVPGANLHLRLGNIMMVARA